MEASLPNQAVSLCRDFKPENLLIKLNNPRGNGLEGSPIKPCPQPSPGELPHRPLQVGDLHLRLIDFGSAVDKHSTEQLYGDEGPSDDEQTAEYAPPEALLARSALQYNHSVCPA